VSIYRVLDKLEAYVRTGTVLPLKRRVLSEERLFEFIEKIRSTLPAEVGQAKLIAKDKDRVLREAQERAQAIVSDASASHAQMVDEHEIVNRARITAETVLREAEARAAKIREGADAYAAQVLIDLDARLSTALGSVKKGIDQLNYSRTAAAIASTPPPSAAAQPLADAAARSKRAAFDAQAEPVEGETAQLESV
jgi:cell division septum initiation protein DivIVA